MSVSAISSTATPSYQPLQQTDQSTTGQQVKKGGGHGHHHKKASGTPQAQQAGTTQAPLNVLSSVSGNASTTQADASTATNVLSLLA